MGIKTLFGRLFSKFGGDWGQGQRVNQGKDGNGTGTQLSCMDCKSTFIFEPGEEKFFKMRGLTPPKRCFSCRSKRKHRR